MPTPYATLLDEKRLQFDQLAFDANAVIDSLRPDRPFPEPLRTAETLLMPLFVLAELRVGVERSQRREENAAAVDALLSRCGLLVPDQATVNFYVRVRSEIDRVRSAPHSFEKREGFGHDLWIAALCLQHDLPLLTKDALFNDISDLRVVGW